MATMDVDNSPEQAELGRLLEQEKEQLMAKEMVSKLTSVCWDKCMTSTPGSKLSPGETSALFMLQKPKFCQLNKAEQLRAEVPRHEHDILARRFQLR
ncbi:hypothetical protein SORBI_3002G259532 [Sorghum bicolor]|uniref:Mitochondrial import inner membrane translocase subunit n=1 Tax=Sorghum bicolor TaxID=4558 RepID=A0A1W0W5S4_SORBI|nr:hypothetical protein SORBI_3002G259532 [Sorghum bicolor]